MSCLLVAAALTRWARAQCTDTCGSTPDSTANPLRAASSSTGQTMAIDGGRTLTA